MQQVTCAECEKQFRNDDVAPFQRNMDGTLLMGCRKCIGKWLKEGFLKGEWPFWARQQGLDVPNE